MSQPTKKVLKKIKPYPFEALLEIRATKMNVDVIYVGPVGLIVHLHSHFVKLGEHGVIDFELPVHRTHIHAQVIVVRTYDKSGGAKDAKPERMAELHFEKLPEDRLEYIHQFVRAIGQAR